MKKIIFSADDFGRSHERNLAIDYAFKNGLIKSAALMVNTPFTEEAVEMARAGGYINRLHCHLNLVSGDISGNSKPLNSKFAESDVFCKNGDFRENGDYNFYNRNSLKYSNIVFLELEAQYKKFIELTENKGNNFHIDFHLYYNQNFPVAYAMRKLVKKYNIQTVRYYGYHQRFLGKRMKLRLFLNSLLQVNKTNVVKSSRVDYYLNKKELFKDDEYIELFVHPNYVDGKLIDNTVSNFGNAPKLLTEHYDLIKNDGEIISWNDLNR